MIDQQQNICLAYNCKSSETKFNTMYILGYYIMTVLWNPVADLCKRVYVISQTTLASSSEKLTAFIYIFIHQKGSTKYIFILYARM